jgi:hypothetical protein
MLQLHIRQRQKKQEPIDNIGLPYPRTEFRTPSAERPLVFENFLEKLKTKLKNPKCLHFGRLE